MADDTPRPLLLKHRAPLQVGDGVRDLAEGDVVIPSKPHFGTWRTLAVCQARDVLKLPTGLLAMEHAALACHLCTAYRLLESCRTLQVCHPQRGLFCNRASWGGAATTAVSRQVPVRS